MHLSDEFELLHSSLWLDYTQRRYLTPEEIRYRLQQQGSLPSDWSDLEKKLIYNRKTGSIPLFLSSLHKKFWYFSADSLIQKENEIERLGNELYRQIHEQVLFKKDFFLDSTIEECITSAIYEGAHSTRAQAQQFIASEKIPKNKDEWMLVNNFKAMNWVKQNSEQPISKEVVLELHRIVTKNTMEGDDIHFSGKFRNGKVFIGSHEGINYQLIEEALEESILLITNHPRYIPPLLRGILLHYLIAYIHPFFDGNGRTARALFYFNCMRNHLDYIQLLSVSAYLKEHGTQYEKAFEKVLSNDFDVTYFIDFCLDSIHFALISVSKKVSYLFRIKDLGGEMQLSVQQIGLLQRMALHPFRMVSIEEYAQQINRSREMARQELKFLTSLGLVQECKQSKKLVYSVNKRKLDSLVGRG